MSDEVDPVTGYRAPTAMARMIQDELKKTHADCPQYGGVPVLGTCVLRFLTDDDVQEILDLAATMAAAYDQGIRRAGPAGQVTDPLVREPGPGR